MFDSALRSLVPAGLALLATACATPPVAAQPPAGATLYARHCASCHGPAGEGDGPVAAVIAVSVPNLRTLRQRAGGSFPREAVMRYIDGRDLPAAHGQRLMPVWGDTFAGTGDDAAANAAEAAAAIAAITDFIATLQR